MHQSLKDVTCSTSLKLYLSVVLRSMLHRNCGMAASVTASKKPLRNICSSFRWVHVLQLSHRWWWFKVPPSAGGIILERPIYIANETTIYQPERESLVIYWKSTATERRGEEVGKTEGIPSVCWIWKLLRLS